MAAGLEGLQLVFFPSGFTGAKEDHCSVFLYCPGDTMLKFLLSAGPHRRDARISFEQPGFFGRTNFCRFDSCIDSIDDSVLLVLEIEEALQSEKQTLTHGTASKPWMSSGKVNHHCSSATLSSLADSSVGPEKNV